MKTQDAPKRKPRLEYQRNYMRNLRAKNKKERKSKKVDQICPTCESAFQAYPSQNRIFCSTECRGKSQQISLHHTCVCGKVFKVSPSRIENGGALYCSRECYDKAHNITLNCETCGKEFSNIASMIGAYCSNECASTGRKLDIEEVKRRFQLADIEMLGVYVNKETKVPSQCLKCLHKWDVLPGSIFGRHGCPNCKAIKQGLERRISQSDAEERFRESGVIMLEPYLGMRTPIKVKYPCGHEMPNLPDYIIGSKGHGCPLCNPKGFKHDRPGTLYYIRIFNPFGLPVYKIGVTNKTVTKRYLQEKATITVIMVKAFPLGKDAFLEEQRIVIQYAEFLYTGPTLMKYTRNSEIFSVDVLCLDKNSRDDTPLSLYLNNV